MLFALEAPQQGGAAQRAFEAAREELRDAGAQIALKTEPEVLIDLARLH